MLPIHFWYATEHTVASHSCNGKFYDNNYQCLRAGKQAGESLASDVFVVSSIDNSWCLFRLTLGIVISGACVNRSVWKLLIRGKDNHNIMITNQRRLDRNKPLFLSACTLFLVIQSQYLIFTCSSVSACAEREWGSTCACVRYEDTRVRRHYLFIPHLVYAQYVIIFFPELCHPLVIIFHQLQTK